MAQIACVRESTWSIEELRNQQRQILCLLIPVEAFHRQIAFIGGLVQVVFLPLRIESLSTDFDWSSLSLLVYSVRAHHSL